VKGVQEEKAYRDYKQSDCWTSAEEVTSNYEGVV